MSIYFDFKTIRELIENNNKKSIYVTRRVVEETYDFSPDDCVEYITPLVDSALEEANGELI